MRIAKSDVCDSHVVAGANERRLYSQAILRQTSSLSIASNIYQPVSQYLTDECKTADEIPDRLIANLGKLGWTTDSMKFINKRLLLGKV